MDIQTPLAALGPLPGSYQDETITEIRAYAIRHGWL